MVAQFNHFDIVATRWWTQVGGGWKFEGIGWKFIGVPWWQFGGGT